MSNWYIESRDTMKQKAIIFALTIVVSTILENLLRKATSVQERTLTEKTDLILRA